MRPPRRFTLQDVELVSKGKNLGHKPGSGLEQRAKKPEKRFHHFDHGAGAWHDLSSEGYLSLRMEFSVGTDV